MNIPDFFWSSFSIFTFSLYFFKRADSSECQLTEHFWIQNASGFKDAVNETLMLPKGNTLPKCPKDVDQSTSAHSEYNTLKNPATFQNESFTCYFQFVTSDFSLQINPSPFLSVIHATEARDVYHTLLMHIHITRCGYRSVSDSCEKLIIWFHSKHWAEWKLRLLCLIAGNICRLQPNAFWLTNMASFHPAIHFVYSEWNTEENNPLQTLEYINEVQEKK